MNILTSLKKTKTASESLASIPTAKKNAVLKILIRELNTQKENIIAQNKIDIHNAIKNNKTAAFIDRLTIDEKIINSMITQLEKIILQADPLLRILENKTLDNGVHLRKIPVPIGVIAIIYESRPNVTIDAAALCIKSGNAVILKGGSEALHTNCILVQCISAALIQNNIPSESVLFIDSTRRSIINRILKESRYVDLLIPRGGYELVQTVVKLARIPVLYHAAGGARIYIDDSANLQKAVQICVHAKVSRPGTCNSLDTVVVHKKIASQVLPILYREMKKNNVKLYGDRNTARIIEVQPNRKNEYRIENLDLILSIKIVSSQDEAIQFIKKYSKGHSEGIVAENKKIIEVFKKKIDAAAVFVNCTTRFHDGGVFQLGAEMGIATGKLHARGPVGLNELTTYKWVAEGKGQYER